jgi:hypothetical protein
VAQNYNKTDYLANFYMQIYIIKKKFKFLKFVFYFTQRNFYWKIVCRIQYVYFGLKSKHGFEFIDIKKITINIKMFAIKKII